MPNVVWIVKVLADIEEFAALANMSETSKAANKARIMAEREMHSNAIRLKCFDHIPEEIDLPCKQAFASNAPRDITPN